MCCQKLQKSRNRCRAWLNQPVHPLWLRIKDKELMNEFNKTKRAGVAKAWTYCAGMHWIYAVIFVLMRFGSMEAQGLFFLQFMSITVSLTIVTVMSKLIPASMDFTCMFLIGVRIVITIMLFNLVDSDSLTFKSIDRKALHDSLTFIALPSFAIGSINWKMDVLTTFPITLVLQVYFTRMAFTTADGNMECYRVPEVIAGSQTFRCEIQLMGLIVIGYFLRRLELDRFLDKEIATK